MKSTLLGMFARYWQPGRAKTRLATTIGNEPAAAIQRLFVDTLAIRMSGVADHRVLACTPAESCPEMRTLVGSTWQVQPQAVGDLGARMQAFFQQALTDAERVVLIGSDSPDLPRLYVEQAFIALKTNNVVLGPSADGGYYLIGAAERVPPVFNQIDWGTPEVWRQTVSALHAASISWHELPPWYDVDDEPGLQQLINQLIDGSCDEPRLALLAEQLSTLLRDRASV